MPLRAKISRIEEDVAVLKTTDGQELRFPVSEMNGKPEINSELLIVVAPLHAEDAGSRPLAKHVVNELLGSQEQHE
ncbi:MAG: hypothetical protein WC477_04260 [Patescibacteria group bacterium]